MRPSNAPGPEYGESRGDDAEAPDEARVMLNHRRTTRHRLVAALALAAAALLALPALGTAAGTTSTLEDITFTEPAALAGPLCAEREVSQPFLPWGDSGDYFVAPNGGFEDRFAGWRFGAGTRVGSGNERLGLVAPGLKMLRLGGSGTATSEPFCVTDAEESFRFAVRNAGDPSSTLDVWADVTYVEGETARATSVHLGTVQVSETAWEPSPIFAYGRFPTKDAMLSIRFEATSPNSPGDWRVDAVLVDPYRCC